MRLWSLWSAYFSLHITAGSRPTVKVIGFFGENHRLKQEVQRLRSVFRYADDRTVRYHVEGDAMQTVSLRTGEEKLFRVLVLTFAVKVLFNCLNTVRHLLAAQH